MNELNEEKLPATPKPGTGKSWSGQSHNGPASEPHNYPNSLKNNEATPTTVQAAIDQRSSNQNHSHTQNSKMGDHPIIIHDNTADLGFRLEDIIPPDGMFINAEAPESEDPFVPTGHSEPFTGRLVEQIIAAASPVSSGSFTRAHVIEFIAEMKALSASIWTNKNLVGLADYARQSAGEHQINSPNYLKICASTFQSTITFPSKG